MNYNILQNLLVLQLTFKVENKNQSKLKNNNSWPSNATKMLPSQLQQKIDVVQTV